MAYRHKGIEKSLVNEMASLGVRMHAKSGGDNRSYMLNENSYTADRCESDDIIEVYEKIEKIGTSFAGRYRVLGENTCRFDDYNDGRLSCIGIVNEARDWADRFRRFRRNGHLTEAKVESFFKHSYNLGVELMAILDRV